MVSRRDLNVSRLSLILRSRGRSALWVSSERLKYINSFYLYGLLIVYVIKGAFMKHRCTCQVKCGSDYICTPHAKYCTLFMLQNSEGCLWFIASTNMSFICSSRNGVYSWVCSYYNKTTWLIHSMKECDEYKIINKTEIAQNPPYFCVICEFYRLDTENKSNKWNENSSYIQMTWTQRFSAQLFSMWCTLLFL